MKLITLNIEGNRHLEAVRSFINRERPHVLCLQEVFETDAKALAEEYGMTCTYAAAMLQVYDSTAPQLQPVGVAILTAGAPVASRVEHYWNAALPVAPYTAGTERRSLIVVELQHAGRHYVCGTTHMLVTPNGLPTTEQREAVAQLLGVLSGIPDIILCGDFNMPRGFNDLYEQFVPRYTDTIPPAVRTTLDLDIHRERDNIEARKRMEQFVVDYVFTTPTYAVSVVSLASGISDHCAVVAEF